ncbi:hypothetical protein Hypma_005425 [Hypsizygus marmoreus]|uniref:Uncharacterized protein n=1 Tax=Hypsizygus marmoreus TaxID=39966 RepID=A0A369J365_HYPMA|nr:hypothetical protein Hypma_005425 [Hypsizygus marmoreus]
MATDGEACYQLPTSSINLQSSQQHNLPSNPLCLYLNHYHFAMSVSVQPTNQVLPTFPSLAPHTSDNVGEKAVPMNGRFLSAGSRGLSFVRLTCATIMETSFPKGPHLRNGFFEVIERGAQLLGEYRWSVRMF